MADDTPQEIHEVEIPDVSPARVMNPIEFFTPGGNPVGGRDFRPTTFVFKNDDNEEDDDEEDDQTEDGHGNMAKATPHVPTHPSENRRNLRRNPQQELEFDSDLVPDHSSVPQTEQERAQHPAESEERKNAPGITGSKLNQHDQE